MQRPVVPASVKHHVKLDPNHIMPAIEAIILRAQATSDTQAAIAGTWVWDEKTGPQWVASLTAIEVKKIAISDLEGVYLLKRADFENTITTLHDLTVEGLSMARVKWRKDAAKKAVLSGLSASGGGRETVEREAQAWESVWQSFDDTWEPSATNNIADFRTLITSTTTKEKAYGNAHTLWRKGVEELQAEADVLWDDCVAWYAAATILFKEGTAVGDLIRSTIPTSPTTPEPTPVEIATATPQAPSRVALVYVPGGGAHSTTTMVQWQVVDVDADFGHDTTLNPAGQTITVAAAAGATVRIRIRTTNSSGTTFGAVKTVTLI